MKYYPTVLFYEKLAAEEEDDMEYEESRDFNIPESHLRDITSQAVEMDQFVSGDFMALYGGQESALQEAIEI